MCRKNCKLLKKDTPCITDKPSVPENYEPHNDKFRCIYFPESLDFQSDFFLNLAYKVFATRDSNHNINHTYMIELSKIYDLSKDDFLLLSDIVEEGQQEYLSVVEEKMNNSN